MCGIVGYVGSLPVKDILINGLKKLEYRGYDSAGVAMWQPEGLEVVHRVGKVANLAAACEHLGVGSTCGIAHTRWATHGRPSEANAHPHVSCDGRIAVVHNGIIENYAELRAELIDKGHVFHSDTDTEVVAHLVEEYYEGDLLRSVRAAVRRLVGAFGLVVTCADEAQTLVVARKDSPIVMGQNADGCYVASDMVALAKDISDIIVLEDYELAKVTPGGMTFCNVDGDFIDPEVIHVERDLEEAEKGGYPDFMMKEIYEQPRVIRETLGGRMVNGMLSIEELDLSVDELSFIDRVYIIACGTSYHAGLIAKNLIESWARIPTEVEVASEFRYRNPIITPSTLVVAVSQSGETADTKAAISDARVRGAKVFAITNVVDSSIARESDGVIYTKAKKEISVASTKSFTGQVASLTLLAMLLGQSKGRLSSSQIRVMFRELADTAGQVEEILANTSVIERAAHACKDATSAFYIGRGISSAICCEGALKLKEISYLHAEAYAAGEMKHGPIALIHEGFPVVTVATKSPVYEKTLSNLQESKTRGALIVAVATEGDEKIKEFADYVLYVPKVRDAFSPITVSVVLQLFARYIAVARGCNVDQPRNLAKSVTVE